MDVFLRGYLEDFGLLAENATNITTEYCSYLTKYINCAEILRLLLSAAAEVWEGDIQQ
jgi:hypothetical protein